MTKQRKTDSTPSDEDARGSRTYRLSLQEEQVVEEAQTVGADVVPSVTIDVGPEHAGAARDRATQQLSNSGTQKPGSEPTLLSDWDYHLFNEGSHNNLWEKLGAHPVEGGTIFGVWAPNAQYVSVVGDFNGWNRTTHPLTSRGENGIWEGFIPHVGKRARYKYFLSSKLSDYIVEK